MNLGSIFKNLFDNDPKKKDPLKKIGSSPAIKATAAKVGLSTTELQKMMLVGLEDLQRRVQEPNAEIPLLFRSARGIVLHTFFPVAVKAHWNAEYGIYDIELFADSANVRVFGDNADSTNYTLHIMLPRDVQTGVYEFFGKCDYADAVSSPCIDIDVYDGVGDTQSGHVEVTREGDNLTLKFALVSYVDAIFGKAMNDTVTVSGTFENVILPEPY